MTDLPGRAINAAPQFSIKNNSAADAGAERHANERAISLSGAAPHLANRGSVGVILQDHRPVEFALQRGRETKAIETRHVRSFDNYTLGDVYGTGDYY